MEDDTMTKRELTCIICPRGCQLSVTMDESAETAPKAPFGFGSLSSSVGEELSVAGNMCPRGKIYAIMECKNPVRTVTTTARTSDGGVVAVKTESPIPKDKMMECMALINSCVVELPVRVGDVILEDVFGSSVVVTQNKG